MQMWSGQFPKGGSGGAPLKKIMNTFFMQPYDTMKGNLVVKTLTK